MNCEKIIDPPWEYARVCLDIIPDADNDGHSIFYQEKNLCDQCWRKVKDVF
jgi:hypothetical protein